MAIRDGLRVFAQSQKPLTDVLASRLTAPYDAKWGHGPVSSRAFLTAAYASMLRPENR
jgi:hypothetical protein